MNRNNFIFTLGMILVSSVAFIAGRYSSSKTDPLFDVATIQKDGAELAILANRRTGELSVIKRTMQNGFLYHERVKVWTSDELLGFAVRKLDYDMRMEEEDKKKSDKSQ